MLPTAGVEKSPSPWKNGKPERTEPDGIRAYIRWPTEPATARGPSPAGPHRHPGGHRLNGLGSVAVYAPTGTTASIPLKAHEL